MGAQHSDHAPVLGIALVSFGTLLLELALTRLFSVVLFYHFAFFAISIALLGLGVGGVFAFIRRQQLARWSTRRLAARICITSSIAILVGLEVVLHMPVSLQLTGQNFIRITVIYLFAAAPFFFTGLLFSIVFAREPERISHFYGADLMGGAAACLAVVPLLNLVGGPNAVIFAALVIAAAAFLWARSLMAHRAALAFGIFFIVLIGTNTALHGRLVDIVYAKGMRRDQPWVLFSKWNAISRVEVDQQGDAKTIVIDADASTSIMNADPAHWEEHDWKKNLMSAAPAVVNVLRPHGDYAIIGPGGGVDVLRALANGSRNVTAIEINPIIANDIMRGRYADYAYHLYQRPEVHLHVQDGRSFIRNSKDKYDVIQMTLVDTWASTAAGAFALSENNLYTVEAFKEYFDHLKPDGMIAITRWEFKEPREALRVVSQGIEALKEMRIRDLPSHFIVVADGDLTTDGRPVAVVIKKGEFTLDEVEQIWQYSAVNPRLHLIYTQPVAYSAPKAALEARVPFFSLITPDAIVYGNNQPTDSKWSSRPAFVEQYPYDIAPVHDDAPFFFFTFKTRRLFDEILHPTGQGIDWKVNLGVAVLFMLLAISFIAVLGFLILPLALHAPARSARILPLIYFVAIGLGYILVEISFIQRFVLFLGHPTYALTVVIFLLLLSSGAGSLAARKWIQALSLIRVPLAAIVLVLVAYWAVLPWVLNALIGMAFPLKLLLSAATLVPLGFAMGMPFPTALRALEGSNDAAIEWAWAMNAGASVLGSVLAMVIAIHFGLNITLVTGAACYFAAGLLTVAFSERREQLAAA